MFEKIKETLEEINVDLSDDKPQLRQDFVTFKAKEFDAMREAEKILKEKLGFVVSKSRAIALVCKLLEKAVIEVERNKKDGKE
jgi:hypothetical protein